MLDVHVHVLPRRAGDNLLLNWDRDRTDQNKADSVRIAEIAARNDIEIPVVAHAGDGNTHPLIVFDAADPDSSRRAHQAMGCHQ